MAFGERYALEYVDAAGTTTTLGFILGLNIAGTTRRAFLYDLIFGITDTAADNQIHYTLDRYTASTNTTALTPNKLDPGGPAAINGGIRTATDFTITYSDTQLLNFGANQRSTQRWVAAPGSEIIAPATASNGLGFSAVHASSAPNIGATMLFME